MEKLIRDKVHSIPHPVYPNMQTRKVVDIREHIALLIAKIIEEKNEFDIAIGIGKIEEAGDVLEVYDTLITLYMDVGNTSEQIRMEHERELFFKECNEKLLLDLEKILSLQIKKRENKGGFQEGIIWTNV